MHALLLGGTGFVGSALQEVLDARGISYATASRRPNMRVHHVQLDITDTPLLERAIRESDVVVNLVAASPLLPAGNRHVYLHCHLRGVQSVLAAMAGIHDVRLIHLGALGVELSNRADYAWTKARAEKLVRESNVSALVLSPAILFGNGSELILTLRRLTRLPIAPIPRIAARFQPLSVHDLAGVIADAIESFAQVAPENARQVEVVGPETVTGTEFARRFLEAGSTRVLEIPASATEMAIRAGSWLRLPGFPVDLGRMLSMPNCATGRFPAVQTSTSYAEWLARAF
jgi:NADH dehydrogenase